MFALAIGFGASVVAGVGDEVGADGSVDIGAVGSVDVGADGSVDVGADGFTGAIGVDGEGGCDVAGTNVGADGVEGAVTDGEAISVACAWSGFPMTAGQLADNAAESGVEICPSPHTMSPPKCAVIPIAIATTSVVMREIFNKPGHESLRTSDVMNASAINPAELPIPNQRCKNNS